MADVVNQENYENMMYALKVFSKSAEDAGAELLACCEQASQVFPSGDKISDAIVEKAKTVAVKYQQIANAAVSVADSIQADLDQLKIEGKIWS